MKKLKKKIEKFVKRVQKWWGKLLKKRDAPSPITGVEYDMKNALIKWVLPDTRESGGPLPIDEVASTEISMSADLGANWTVIRDVPAPTAEWQLSDLAPGDYMLQLVAIDTDGRRATDTPFSFNIKDETNPSPVTNVSVELT